MNYGDLLALLAPEAILALVILLVLAADLGPMRRRPGCHRRAVAASLVVAGCVGAIYWI